MPDRIRWGILGTGRIAAKFAAGLAAVPDAELAAVASRSADTAAAFARQAGAGRAHAGYRALVEDPGVDVVYIATPHSSHRDDTLLALEAGKPVLCEKPLAMNAAQAAEMIAAARARRLFLMEAMWTRFFPLVIEAKARIDAGAIGRVRLVAADLGIRRTPESRPRLFKPELGGGALLDVGVYPISLATWLLGIPAEVRSLVSYGPSGVDEAMTACFGYPDGRQASLYSAITTETPKEAHLLGEAGSIKLHANFVCPTRITIQTAGAEPVTIEHPLTGNGLNYEAVEVHACLRDGRLESRSMPLHDSLGVMETIDAVRRAWQPAAAG